MATIMQMETQDSEHYGSTAAMKVFAKTETLDEANAICDKMNRINAFYAKMAGSIIKFFYEVRSN